ncbi:MAG: hypothetical protein LBD84_03450 [Campylobacteraceae bacterium]|jgi:hypothetical protein|nr:hypothetical protein [Campylobacteraceae bacterium]
MDRKTYKKEREKALEIREDLWQFLDKTIPKQPGSLMYDFDISPKLDAKKFYEIFYKYDYQVRKALALGLKLAE